MNDESTEPTEGAGPADDVPRHPIGVVATRTGLSPSALRAWERRYALVEPGRSDGGQRLYSDADVERLSLLKRVTDAGRSIGTVADRSTAELREMATEDEAARRRMARWEGRGAEASAEGGPEPADLLEAAREAVDAMEAAGLEAVLKRGVVTLGAERFTDELLAPFLTGVGEGWEAGDFGPAHEHVATAVVRRVLDWMLEPVSEPAGPPVVIGTLPGEEHELGAMVAAVTAALEGWRVTYLGPDLPPEELEAAAHAVAARLVGISAVNPVDGNGVVRGLAELRRRLPVDVELMVGGAAAEAVVAATGEGGIRAVATLAEFRRELRRRVEE